MGLGGEFGPGRGGFPDPDGGEAHFRAQGVAGAGGTGVVGKGLDRVIEDGLGHQFRGRVLVLEADDPVAIAGLEVCVGRVVGVHAKGMVEAVEPIFQSHLDDFEVANHLVFIEFRRLNHDFHLPGVPVRELALVRMLGKHVAVFDVDGLADAVGHGKNVGLRQGTYEDI